MWGRVGLWAQRGRVAMLFITTKPTPGTCRTRRPDELSGHLPCLGHRVSYRRWIGCWISADKRRAPPGDTPLVCPTPIAQESVVLSAAINLSIASDAKPSRGCELQLSHYLVIISTSTLRHPSHLKRKRKKNGDRRFITGNIIPQNGT